jgi:hypothetical protein
VPPEPEPPDIALGRRKFIVRQKILEKLGAKWTIGELNIFLNLLGQIHKSLPSILHNYHLIHVLSSGEHFTIPFLSHVSPKEYPLPFGDMIQSQLSNTIECELGQYFNPMGQTQDDFCLNLKEVAI